VLPLIQNGRHSNHLGFGFRRLFDKLLSRLVRFFCGLLGVSAGRLLSMTSAAAHSGWPLRQPSWTERLGQLVQFFCGLLGVTGGRFLLMISTATHSRWLLSHLRFGFRQLSDECLSRLVDFLVAYSGEWRKAPFDDQCRRRSFKMATMAAILDLVSVCYLTNGSRNKTGFSNRWNNAYNICCYALIALWNIELIFQILIKKLMITSHKCFPLLLFSLFLTL
jgi:hypothetical protein